MRRWRGSAALALLLAGCQTSARFPLCPALAEVSYAPRQPGALVNRLLGERAAAHHVRIEALSPFAARFRGTEAALRWFERDYPDMICAFDARQVTLARETWLVCMDRARSWTAALRSGDPGRMMDDRTKYYQVCAPRVLQAAPD